MPRTANGDTRRRPVAKGEIERAATRVFRREGFRGSTMQHIADEVGLHKTSLYHHITSKEALLLAIAEIAMVEPLEQLQEIAADNDLDAAGRLRAAVRSLVYMVTDRADPVAVFIMYAHDIVDPERRRFFAQQRHDYGAIVEDLVAACLDRSGLPDDPRTTASAILGMCNWTLHWYQPGHRESPEEMAQAYSTVALRMVGLRDQEA